MIGKILHPPEYEVLKGPLIFLAGPIQGAYEWQSSAIQYIQAKCPKINIANPRRPLESEEDDSISNSPIIQGYSQSSPFGRATMVEMIVPLEFWLGEGNSHEDLTAGKTTSSGDFSDEKFNEQADWETFHLRRASTEGCILFWLAKEYEPICDRAYAQTTRFELAEWKMRHERDGAKLIVGIEKGFTGARYIKRRLSQDCPEVKICSSLEQTCKEAIKAVFRKK